MTGPHTARNVRVYFFYVCICGRCPKMAQHFQSFRNRSRWLDATPVASAGGDWHLLIRKRGVACSNKQCLWVTNFFLQYTTIYCANVVHKHLPILYRHFYQSQFITLAIFQTVYYNDSAITLCTIYTVRKYSLQFLSMEKIFLKSFCCRANVPSI